MNYIKSKCTWGRHRAHHRCFYVCIPGSLGVGNVEGGWAVRTELLLGGEGLVLVLTVAADTITKLKCLVNRLVVGILYNHSSLTTLDTRREAVHVPGGWLRPNLCPADSVQDPRQEAAQHSDHHVYQV